MKTRSVRLLCILAGLLLVSIACLPVTPTALPPAKTSLASPSLASTSASTPSETPQLPNPEAGSPQPAAPAQFHTGDPVVLSEIKMLDLNQGWAASGPYILVTADGGQSWHERTPPQDFADPLSTTAYTAFLDNQTAWVLYGDDRQIPSDASIWSTADGGLTWRASAPLMHEAYGDKVWAEFASFGEDTGWLMLRGVYVGAGTHFAMQLLHSTDSGLTWVSLPGADIGVDYTSLTFANTETGWMGWQSLGAYYGGPPEYGVTADGGRTWQAGSLPPPAEAPGLFEEYVYSEPYRIRLLSPDSVRLLVGAFGNQSQSGEFAGYLYSSDDRGATWSIFPLPSGVFPEDYDLIFFDAQNALLLGRDSYRSADGGASWQHVSTVYWDGQYSFVDPQHGWAVVHMDEEYALVRSVDGGESWQIIPAVIAP